MDHLNGTDVAFLDAFRLAATVTITALLPKVSDDTVKTIINKVVENINTDIENTTAAVNIIYKRAMHDKNWTDVAVKLLNFLYYALPTTLIDPGTPNNNVDE